MNKRIKRKIEKRRRKEVLQILDLALQVNGLDCRKQELTGNLPTVMIYFHGHVARLDMTIYTEGYQEGQACLREDFGLYTDSSSFQKEAAAIADGLVRILNQKGV